MKELSSHIKESVKIHVERQHEKHRKHVGSFIKHNGHTIWQVDLKTQEITPAEFSETFATIGGGVTRNIVKKDNHWYCSALNKKSAFNKFNKMAKIFFEKNHQHDRTDNNR